MIGFRKQGTGLRVRFQVTGFRLQVAGSGFVHWFVGLGVVDFFDAGDGVNFGDGLVGADSQDAGKAEGEAARVAGGAHDVVEGDLEDDEDVYKRQLQE